MEDFHDLLSAQIRDLESDASLKARCLDRVKSTTRGEEWETLTLGVRYCGEQIEWLVTASVHDLDLVPLRPLVDVRCRWIRNAKTDSDASALPVRSVGRRRLRRIQPRETRMRA